MKRAALYPSLPPLFSPSPLSSLIPPQAEEGNSPLILDVCVCEGPDHTGARISHLSKVYVKVLTLPFWHTYQETEP